MFLHWRLPSAFLFAVLVICAAAGVRAATLEQIPSPRPTGWVTDLTGTLPLQTVAELNRMGDEVKAQTGAQMAVVAVLSTDGAPTDDFAHRLFNAWGIGERGRGLLVFVSLSDQKTEIVLGDGISDAARIRESQAVMQVEMAPRFRRGDPAGAISQGAAACARRILGANVAAPAADPGLSTAAILPASDEPLPSTALPDLQAGAASASAPSSRDGAGLLLGTVLLCGGLLAGWLIALKLLYSFPHPRRQRITLTRLDQAVSDATGTW